MKIYNYFRLVFKKIIILVINLIITGFSFFIPKSEKIIIVGGWFGQRFADNSKYLYLYADEYKEELSLEKVIFVTRDNKIKDELDHKGYEVYNIWSLPSIWYHLRAKYHFIDQSPNDINSFFSVRSIRINLWHGFPLKTIGKFQGGSYLVDKIDNNIFLETMYNLSTKGFWSDRYLLTTSEFAAEIMGEAFRIPNKKRIISGYPRNYETVFNESINFEASFESDDLEKIRSAKKNNKCLFAYLPTFRDYMDTKIFGTKDIDELLSFLDFLESQNIIIIGKFHFANKDKDMMKISSHKAFINLSSDVDVYSFIKYSDVLITDYSSIYFDYLLSEKPIVFFPYDLNYYMYEDRGLIFDYNEYTPGPIVKNIEEFENLLVGGTNKLIYNYHNNYDDKAKCLKKKIFNNPKNMDIEHFFNELKSL
jgi:CDP-glycerol glycerophosphotransferase